MTDPELPIELPLPRSPELMSRDDTLLLVVDVQEKLIPLVSGHERIIWNIRRLLDAANTLDVPALATEQYPKGLGATLPELAERLGDIPDKLEFSCSACEPAMRKLLESRRRKVLVCGIECHVCVQQTVLNLLAAGFAVYVAADAVGARHQLDYEFGLQRMEASGATLTTAEAAMFEWCQVAGTPEFKVISQLVRETPPADDDLG